MAKRIRVKGKNPPRGLSKVERRAYAHAARTGDHDLKISVDMNRDRNISRTPSSTRKKLVKEGSRKFVGPRSKQSEEREYEDDIFGRSDFLRGYKKKDARLDERYAYEDNKAYEDRVGTRRASLEPRLARKVGSALEMFMASPGADRSMQRSELARVILAAKKIKNPEARNKVLSLIKNKMSRARGVNVPYSKEEIPF
jgi:hypothetical protein